MAASHTEGTAKWQKTRHAAWPQRDRASDKTGIVERAGYLAPTANRSRWHPRTKAIRGKANYAQAPAHRRAGVPVATHAIGRSGERSVRPGITRRRPRRHP